MSMVETLADCYAVVKQTDKQGMITVVTSPEFIRTVSFQPTSLGSGRIGCAP